jgi:hypothetical protein
LPKHYRWSSTVAVNLYPANERRVAFSGGTVRFYAWNLGIVPSKHFFFPSKSFLLKLAFERDAGPDIRKGRERKGKAEYV